VTRLSRRGIRQPRHRVFHLRFLPTCFPDKAGDCSRRFARNVRSPTGSVRSPLRDSDPGYFAVYLASSPKISTRLSMSSTAKAARGGPKRASPWTSWRGPQRYLIGVHAIGLQRKERAGCRPGVPRGLRPGLEVLPAIWGQHHEGHGCGCRACRAQVPRPSAGGHRGRQTASRIAGSNSRSGACRPWHCSS